jgi:hypothetical protein
LNIPNKVNFTDKDITTDHLDILESHDSNESGKETKDSRNRHGSGWGIRRCGWEFNAFREDNSINEMDNT